MEEILVSYCKIQDYAIFQTVVAFGSGITGIREEVLWNHIKNRFTKHVYLNEATEVLLYFILFFLF